MAMYSSNQSHSNSWILSVKIALISTGVLSMAVALKISFPVVAGFVTSEVPSLWTFLLSWLEPPYLYVVINFIIISIVASSKLQQKSFAAEDPPPPPPIAATEKVSGAYGGVALSGYGYDASEAAANVAEAEIVYGQVAAEKISGAYGGVAPSGYGYDASEVAANVAEAEIVYGQARAVEPARVSDAAVPEIEERIKEIETVAAVESGGGDEAVVASSFAWNGLQRKDSVDFSLNESERPPLSARFGHKKSIKASPEGGKSLRVSKPKKQDTFETTWKTITEGRPMPLNRHLKKSDTWESHARRQQQNDPSTPPPPMKKSETFGDRSSLSPSPIGSGKIRREPSLSQDDLNRRVEAFIKKFNEEMRLQRQESLNQYQEMIRSGAY